MINLCNLCHIDIFIINNINIDEFDKIFNFYYINCEIEILFDNNYTANIEFNYHYNTDYINITNYLLLYINISQLAGNKINNNNHLIINTTSCRRNMTYENYINQPMTMLKIRN